MGGEEYQQLLLEFQEVAHSVDKVLINQGDIKDKIDALLSPRLEETLNEIAEVIRTNNEALTRLSEALEQGFGLWRAEG